MRRSHWQSHYGCATMTQNSGSPTSSKMRSPMRSKPATSSTDIFSVLIHNSHYLTSHDLWATRLKRSTCRPPRLGEKQPAPTLRHTCMPAKEHCRWVGCRRRRKRGDSRRPSLLSHDASVISCRFVRVKGCVAGRAVLATRSQSTHARWRGAGEGSRTHRACRARARLQPFGGRSSADTRGSRGKGGSVWAAASRWPVCWRARVLRTRERRPRGGLKPSGHPSSSYS